MATLKTKIGNIKGEDGTSPHIGSNGNWYIGTTDTGVRAKGRDGDGASATVVTPTDGTFDLTVGAEAWTFLFNSPSFIVYTTFINSTSGATSSKNYTIPASELVRDGATSATIEFVSATVRPDLENNSITNIVFAFLVDGETKLVTFETGLAKTYMTVQDTYLTVHGVKRAMQGGGTVEFALMAERADYAHEAGEADHADAAESANTANAISLSKSQTASGLFIFEVQAWLRPKVGEHDIKIGNRQTAFMFFNPERDWLSNPINGQRSSCMKIMRDEINAATSASVNKDYDMFVEATGSNFIVKVFNDGKDVTSEEIESMNIMKHGTFAFTVDIRRIIMNINESNALYKNGDEVSY